MPAARRLAQLLELRAQPVAVKFQDSAPRGIPRIDRAALSGCTYWKYAAEGRTFYTEAPDHYNCPVGAYTHGVDLPADKAQELQQLIGTMVEVSYLDPAEVPGIPHREGPLGVVVYAPLGSASFEPDVVLVSGTARQMMLLAEAARAAGADCETTMVGRPTCAAIPEVMRSGRTATNLGCIGNRVYTELPDDELYFAIAGKQVDAVVEKLDKIVAANRELEKFHLARRT
jgi:uncharacterized protein (DUF169 family)